MTETSRIVKSWPHLLLLATITIGAGCTGFGQALQTNTIAIRPPLTYYAWLETADETTLALERTRLTEQAADSREPEINLVQRALLYTFPAGSGDRDSEAAIEMLNLALREPADTATPGSLRGQYIAFAKIWLTLLEQEQNYQTAQADHNSDKHLVRELSVKVERLQQQIEALTTIEQRLIEREQTQGTP